VYELQNTAPIRQLAQTNVGASKKRESVLEALAAVNDPNVAGMGLREPSPASP